MNTTIDEIYEQTVKDLFARLPMFTRIGAAAYKPNLDNTIRLCEALGNPQLKFKSIHIAGTNGKGSCSHMLSAVLQKHGHKTGLYTSPHISDFRERIRINGDVISKEWVVDFVKKIASILKEIQPSFFEVTVAMAFSYFAEQEVDIAVIEVGLGGLLDSTNVIIPELSIITNISLDHTNLLGTTLHEIATQKAGIMKPVVPVVIGETVQETQTVFLTAAIQQKTTCFFADQIWAVTRQQFIENKQVLQLANTSQQIISTYELDLLGVYQRENLKTVCCALDVLRAQGWLLDDAIVKKALANVMKLTGIQGRFQKVHLNPTVIVDVSHNEAGIKACMRQVAQMHYRQLFIIMGFVRDKDVTTVLKLFPKDAQYLFTQAQIPRALPFEELQQMAKESALQGEGFSTMTEALQSVMVQANEEDLILVTGSFFIADDAFRFFKSYKK